MVKAEVRVVPVVCELLETSEVRGHGFPEVFAGEGRGCCEVVAEGSYFNLGAGFEDHGGYDGEGAGAATAERPEEVGVGGVVGGEEGAGCGDERYGKYVVGGETPEG